MPRPTTPSFVAEFPLKTAPSDERALAVRLDAARQIYNAILGKMLTTLDRMRQSKDWQRARSLKAGAERSALFKAPNERFDFKSSRADRIAIACKNTCWIGDHMTSNETQKAALRAFLAVKEYALGKRRRPRFKRFGEYRSVEGKTIRPEFVFMTALSIGPVFPCRSSVIPRTRTAGKRKRSSAASNTSGLSAAMYEERTSGMPN